MIDIFFVIEALLKGTYKFCFITKLADLYFYGEISLLLTAVNNHRSWMIHFTHLYHYRWLQSFVAESSFDVNLADTRVGVARPVQVSLNRLEGKAFGWSDT